MNAGYNVLALVVYIMLCWNASAMNAALRTLLSRCIDMTTLLYVEIRRLSLCNDVVGQKESIESSSRKRKLIITIKPIRIVSRLEISYQKDAALRTTARTRFI